MLLIRLVSSFIINSLLQAIRIKYLQPDSDLQNYALQVMEMLEADSVVDAHALVFFEHFFCLHLLMILCRM